MKKRSSSACSRTQEEEKKQKTHFSRSNPSMQSHDDMTIRHHCGSDVSEEIPSILADPTKTCSSDVLVQSQQLDPPEMGPSREGEKEARKMDSEGVEECGREKLQRHRSDVAGSVWIPDMWGQEELLNDWIDCAAFDRSLVQSGIMSAREALVAECRRANIWWATG